MRMIASVVLGMCAVAVLFGAMSPVAAPGGEPRFEFLPARQHLWVIDHEKGGILFFKFPDTETRPIQRSKRFEIDRERFPRGQTRYILSEREITSILWLVNEASGEVQVVRYRKDGTFGAEFRLAAARQFQ